MSFSPTLTQSYSQTSTLSPTSSFTPTSTPNAGAPVLAFALFQDQGDAWFGGNDLRYTFSVTLTAGSAVNDLTLTFDSDVSSGNISMDVSNSPNYTGVIGPASWGPASLVDPSQGAVMGPMALSPPQALGFPIRRIFSHVLGQGVDTTVSARAILHSASYGITIMRSLDTYIASSAPLPTLQPSPSPTPFVGQGEMSCYPQPARDQLCFAYQVGSGAGGRLDIKIYSMAFQFAAEVQGTSLGGVLESACVDISGMAPGVYFYRASVADFSFPMGQFGISR